MSLLRGLISENVDRHTKDMITLTATASITSAAHAGRTLLMGEVGGDAAATFTLPAATGTGSIFKFVVSVVNTSNYLIKVADATDTIDGQIMITDADGTDASSMVTAAASNVFGPTGPMNRTFLEPSEEVPYVVVRDNVCLITENLVAMQTTSYVHVRLECAQISLDQATLNQLLRTQTV